MNSTELTHDTCPVMILCNDGAEDASTVQGRTYTKVSVANEFMYQLPQFSQILTQTSLENVQLNVSNDYTQKV
jgi:hypothetical protein